MGSNKSVSYMQDSAVFEKSKAYSVPVIKCDRVYQVFPGPRNI